jgi:hypothetical protein
MTHLNGSKRDSRATASGQRGFSVKPQPVKSPEVPGPIPLVVGTDRGHCPKCGGLHARVIGRSESRPTLYFKCDRCGCLSVGPA